MGRLNLFLVFLFSIFSCWHVEAAHQSPLPGTFAGFVLQEESNLRIPMQMDIVYYEKEGQSFATFFVRLSLGGFVSHEYQAYAFTIEHFKHDSPVLELDGAGNAINQDLSIIGGKTSEDRRTIKGRVESHRAGLVKGRFHLVYVDSNKSASENNKAIFAIGSKRKIFPSLTGSYESDCIGREGLQIEAARSSVNTAQVTSFSGYAITARFTSHNPKASWMVKEIIGESDLTLATFSSERGDFEFDLFRRTLLLSAGDTDTCEIEEDGIHCKKCVFKRKQDSKSQEFLRTLVQVEFPCPKQPLPLLDSLPVEKSVDKDTLVSTVEGEYLGHITIDNAGHDRAFSVRVHFSGLPSPDNTIASRYVTLTAGKHFIRPGGERGAVERILPLHLRRARLSSTARGQVFEGNNGELVQISDWTSSRMRGIIYHHRFGRIGHFFVERASDKVRKAFNELRALGCLEGTYTNTAILSGRTYRSKIQLTLQSESTTEFQLPLSFAGMFILNLFDESFEIAAKLGNQDVDSFVGQKEGSSYDPFTGVGRLKTRGELSFFGKFGDKRLSLYWASEKLHTQVERQHTLRSYDRIPYSGDHLSPIR